MVWSFAIVLRLFWGITWTLIWSCVIMDVIQVTLWCPPLLLYISFCVPAKPQFADGEDSWRHSMLSRKTSALTGSAGLAGQASTTVDCNKDHHLREMLALYNFAEYPASKVICGRIGQVCIHAALWYSFFTNRCCQLWLQDGQIRKAEGEKKSLFEPTYLPVL